MAGAAHWMPSAAAEFAEAKARIRKGLRMWDEMYCPSCGAVGNLRSYYQGSGITGVLLLLVFFPAWIIYVINPKHDNPSELQVTLEEAGGH